MPLDPQDVAAVADSYLTQLTDSADVRAGLTAAGTIDELAAHIASVTGIQVSEADVDAIADYLNAHRSAECEELAMQYPGMGAIVLGSTD